jgi:hypothetical protein
VWVHRRVLVQQQGDSGANIVSLAGAAAAAAGVCQRSARARAGWQPGTGLCGAVVWGAGAIRAAGHVGGEFRAELSWKVSFERRDRSEGGARRREPCWPSQAGLSAGDAGIGAGCDSSGLGVPCKAARAGQRLVPAGGCGGGAVWRVVMLDGAVVFGGQRCRGAGLGFCRDGLAVGLVAGGSRAVTGCIHVVTVMLIRARRGRRPGGQRVRFPSRHDRSGDPPTRARRRRSPPEVGGTRGGTGQALGASTFRPTVGRFPARRGRG